ncbi:MAG: hypothetical protein WD773_10560 [Gemmatimonadales bacterium]
MDCWKVCAFAITLSIIPTFQLSAQDTTRIGGVRPMGAFWRSFLLPGWGQAVTDRHTTGAAFVAWEGVTAMMTLKAQQEANYFKSIGSPNLRLKRQEVQDWLILWIFNHLFSGAEAYVSAHLQDFPPELEVRAFPRGIGVSFPLPPLRKP